MKQENKKRIFALAAFCIALCIVTGMMISKNQSRADSNTMEVAENQTEEIDIDVAEVPVEENPVKEAPTQTITEADAVVVSEISAEKENIPDIVAEADAGTEGNKDNNESPKTSEDKPKTKEEATPPSEPPKVTEETETNNPEKKPEYKEADVKPNESKDTPKSGDKRSDGAIYVPGFGWVEDSGPNVQEYADFDLTDNQVGEMD